MSQPTEFIDCPEWGQGGRFIYDPETGTRTRVPDEPETTAEPEAPVKTAKPSKSVKGSSHE